MKFSGKAPTGYEGGSRKIHTTPDFDKMWYAGKDMVIALVSLDNLDKKHMLTATLKDISCKAQISCEAYL